MIKFLLLTLALSSSLAFAQPKLETIQLNHRLATDVLPEIQALLPENATARAFNDVIIIRAEQDTLRQFKELIRQLDVPIQRLQVTVVKTYDVLHDVDSQTISARADVSDHDLSGHIAIQRWSTQDTKNNEQYYRAQGIASKPIQIDMTEAIPQTEQYLILRADGDLAVQTDTDYIDLRSGFSAVARILPNSQVIVDIHPRFSDLSASTINRSQIVTSLSGPINTWLELGQLTNEKALRKHVTSNYKTHNKQQQRIYLKVNPL